MAVRPARGAPGPRLLPVSMLPTRAGWTLAAMTAAAFGAARTTGSGWAMVVVALAGAALLHGLVAPALRIGGVRRVTCSLPPTWVAGQPQQFEITVPRSLRGACVRALEPATPWVRVQSAGRGRVGGRFPARGVFDRVVIEARCAAPLGLVRWTATRTIDVGYAVEVGPLPADVVLPEALSSNAHAPEDGTWPRPGGDVVSSVREYVPGDPARLVHWPTSARHEGLVVKQLERPRLPTITIVLDLHDAQDVVEAAAARAAGYAIAALRAGAPVRVVTAERGGVADREVMGPMDVAGRLARAIAGPTGPRGPTAGFVLVVSGAGDHLEGGGSG